MKWRNTGLILDWSREVPPAPYFGFAQSPQAVELEDRLRVFFSIRRADGPGMFISDIAFFDLGENWQRLGPVSLSSLEAPPLGAFDEHGVFPLNVLRDDDTLWGYSCGWSRRVSVPVETAIGLQRSDDWGATFHRVAEGPIMTASVDEPFLVGDPFVIKDGEQFRMWYIFGTEWLPGLDGNAERVYKIGSATSEDGVTWHRHNRRIITDVLGPHECQALPSVLKTSDGWLMAFCFRDADGFREDPSRGYRLGGARSADGITWYRDDTLFAIPQHHSAWDRDMRCYPNLISFRGRMVLLYNGNSFGKSGLGMAVATP